MTPVAPAASRRIRTLPIRLDPLPGEALDSWLEAYAARCHDTTWGDFLEAVGLRDFRPGIRRSRYLTGSAPVNLTAVSAATGVKEQVLERMLSGGLHLEEPDANAPAGGSMLRDFMLPASRYCPACLGSNGGRWFLWWRLRWAFACPTHRLLLADLCPDCGRPQRNRAASQKFIPAPGLCAAPAPSSAGQRIVRCGAELSTAETPRLPQKHPALAAQRAILAVFTAGQASVGVYRDSSVTSTQYLRDLTALGMRALRYGSSADLRTAACVGRGARDPLRGAVDSSVTDRLHTAIPSPPTAAQTAVAACAAVPVLAAESVPAAGDRLRWLVESSRAAGSKVNPTNIIWARDTSDTLFRVQLAALAPTMSSTAQLRYRVHSPHPKPVARQIPPVHRSLPALFWYRWILPVCDVSEGLDPHRVVAFEHLRLGLSAAVMVAAGHLHFDRAYHSLARVYTRQTATRTIHALALRPIWPATAVMLGDLADLLESHPAPIDYESRRHLPMDDLLPEPLWQKICRDVGFGPGRGTRIRFIRCWLYERLTGSPGRLCEYAIDTPAFRSTLEDVPLFLSPELVRALDDAAREFLNGHGLGHEPLRWSPPEDVLPEWTSRRPPGTTVDVDALHELVQAHDRPVGAIAASLNTSISMVREVLNDHPAPHVPMTLAQRRYAGAIMDDARRALTRERFTELYVGQQLSLKCLSVMSGFSHSTVKRLAGEYGIPMRSQSRAATARHARAEPHDTR